jgi:hypothetical protein
VNADDEIRTDPKPPDVVLDRDRVPQLIGAAMLAADPDDDDLRRDVLLGHFGWMLDGWDDHGFATVEVVARRDGRVLGSVRLHWSNLS